nr:hypothetical protein [Tanacetum cinerariifolium]
AALPLPPVLVPSLPLPSPSPLTTSPTDTGAPLGYRAAEIKMKALLPSTSRRTDIPEADMPLRKRACLTTPTLGFEIRESFAAGATRQPRPTDSDLRRYRVEQAVAPPSPDYVPGPEHPPSPDYVPGPEHPPSPIEIPYVLEPELCGRFRSRGDPEEDPEDDQADYPADGGDGDDKPFDDDDDDDTDDEDPEDEPFEDEEDDEEEEEHPAPADSSDVPIVDPVLPAGDTEALKADEPTHAPGSPIIISLS